MSSNKKDALEKLIDLESTANAAIRELCALAEILSLQHIEKYSGIELQMEGISLLTSPGVKPPDVALLEIRKRITSLSSKYANVFPHEFSKLNKNTLLKLMCVPLKILYTSTDIVSSVNEALDAMLTRRAEIVDMKVKVSEEAVEGLPKSFALSAFYSLNNKRLLETSKTEKNIYEDHLTEMEQKRKKAEKAQRLAILSELEGSKKPEELAALGISPVPADPVTKVLSSFSLYLMKKQYPKSTRLCRSTKQSLSLDTLQEARFSEAAKAEATATALAEKSKSIPGYGAEQLQTLSFLNIDAKMIRKLSLCLALKGDSTYKPFLKEYESIKKAIQGHTTKEQVQSSLLEIDRLSEKIDASIDQG